MMRARAPSAHAVDLASEAPPGRNLPKPVRQSDKFVLHGEKAVPEQRTSKTCPTVGQVPAVRGEGPRANEFQTCRTAGQVPDAWADQRLLRGTDSQNLSDSRTGSRCPGGVGQVPDAWAEQELLLGTDSQNLSDSRTGFRCPGGRATGPWGPNLSDSRTGFRCPGGVEQLPEPRSSEPVGQIPAARAERRPRSTDFKTCPTVGQVRAARAGRWSSSWPNWSSSRTGFGCPAGAACPALRVEGEARPMGDRQEVRPHEAGHRGHSNLSDCRTGFSVRRWRGVPMGFSPSHPWGQAACMRAWRLGGVPPTRDRGASRISMRGRRKRLGALAGGDVPGEGPFGCKRASGPCGGYQV
ncbi:hypothetical protein COCOR_06669 [Corallococcus coralloides DSM 2259]|uniref:Uncharacterized protein n=1 Tax=Corallococcus coralloides (strain ATCC 25202 / DSM 2259 / NBRC 100086 / M2) TaxID=1144275 RepID=H8MXQ1_CORCM|nr:hypothetical protein COCOR_06669 [Corallococcus coralloides DSM 2259]